MSIIDRAKVLAEIADLAARAYGLLVDKSRATHERDQRIKALEAQVAELKRKIGEP